MPAHTGAAIVSYPQIGLYPQKLSDLPMEKRWAAHEGVLAPRPTTVAFMQDVLTEVMDLFPSQYIHIGGDEANISHWKKCEEMQGLIREMNLKDEAELHSWFIRQMDAFLTSHGRKLVGWDEILQGGLAPGAVVMSWRGEAGGITAAQAGHDVVMAPTSHTYFDYYQGPAASRAQGHRRQPPLWRRCTNTSRSRRPSTPSRPSTSSAARPNCGANSSAIRTTASTWPTRVPPRWRRCSGRRAKAATGTSS